MTLCHVARTVWCGCDSVTCDYGMWKVSMQSLYLLFCLNLVPFFLKLKQFHPDIKFRFYINFTMIFLLYFSIFNKIKFI